MTARFLFVVAALSALSLSLAGAAAGQPFSAGQPLPPEAQLASGLPLTSPSARTHDDWRSAVHTYHLACAADRETFCASKTSTTAQYRCLDYHRLKVSSSCKDALKGVAAFRPGESL